MTSTELNLETLMPWGEAKQVPTAKGPRLLRKAPAPMGSPFWGVWRSNKGDLKAAGISCGKDRATGEWEALWWIPVNTPEVVEDKKEAIAASQATDADIDVPRPEGLEYLPYQRAGVSFCIKAFGKVNKSPSTGTSEEGGKNSPLHVDQAGVLIGDAMGL